MRPSEKDYLNRLINILFERKFDELCSKYLKGRLIDIGCGEKPYKEMVSTYVDEHVGVDHHDTFHGKTNIDLFGTAYDIPVESNSFDSAICTAVLEHLEEPESAIGECYRVLKGGGFAIYSVPFIWHLHEEPRDFFRYSKYGLKYLFEKRGFKVIEISPLSGFVVTFVQLHLYLIKGKFDKGIIKRLRLIKFYSFICTKFALFLNRYDHSKQFTWAYTIVAQK